MGNDNSEWTTGWSNPVLLVPMYRIHCRHAERLHSDRSWYAFAEPPTFCRCSSFTTQLRSSDFYLGPALHKAGYSDLKLMMFDDSTLLLPGWAKTVSKFPTSDHRWQVLEPKILKIQFFWTSRTSEPLSHAPKILPCCGLEFSCDQIFLRMFEIAKKFEWLSSDYSHDEFSQKFFHQGFLAFFKIFFSAK